MIITLAGLPGAGKTTVAKLLSQKLNVPSFSMGDLRGRMAQERGLTIDEFNKLGETEDFTDKDVDAYQTKLASESKNFIIDGWLSWHFIPQSFKVFLDVDAREGAKRIFESSKRNERPDEKKYASVEETQQTITHRVTSTAARYQKYYQVDFLDRSHYDLVVDTTHLMPEEVVQMILDHF